MFVFSEMLLDLLGKETNVSGSFVRPRNILKNFFRNNVSSFARAFRQEAFLTFPPLTSKVSLQNVTISCCTLALVLSVDLGAFYLILKWILIINSE